MTGGSASGGFAVEVRRPLHRPSPTDRLGNRWRARRERRRAKRGARRGDTSRSKWYDYFDIPLDFDAFAVLAIVVAIVLLLVFGLPFLWILVLFVIEFLVWVALAVAGGAAWLVLGRPWQVVVVDPAGTDVASAAVRGRRSAHEHGDRVRARLSAGATPDAAVMVL